MAFSIFAHGWRVGARGSLLSFFLNELFLILFNFSKIKSFKKPVRIQPSKVKNTIRK
jgi:hypothetical protein